MRFTTDDIIQKSDTFVPFSFLLSHTNILFNMDYVQQKTLSFIVVIDLPIKN
jgi:hypothetical protein